MVHADSERYSSQFFTSIPFDDDGDDDDNPPSPWPFTVRGLKIIADIII
jgi:hypothetical protein